MRQESNKQAEIAQQNPLVRFHLLFVKYCELLGGDH
jgi:hypothetical protein